MDMQPIAPMQNSENIMVVDLDTGTVLGTNLALVYVAYPSIEHVCSSDAFAIEYARLHGRPLFADMDDN